MALLTETGLLSAHIPAHQTYKASTSTGGYQPAIRPSPASFNASQAPLKLGLPPLGEKLSEEVRKVVKMEEGEEEARRKGKMKDGTGRETGVMEVDVPTGPSTDPSSTALGVASAGTGGAAGTVGTGAPSVAVAVALGGKDKEPDTLIIPREDDLLPLPTNFRTFDVKREVEKILDSRKRIRLGSLASSSSSAPESVTQTQSEARWEGAGIESRVVLPSICAYTFHDSGEGVTSTAFSVDSSLLAAGSEESCVRLWSLKGEKLRGLRSDPEVGNVADGKRHSTRPPKQSFVSFCFFAHYA